MIDDDPDITRMTQIALEALVGWEVIIANSGTVGISIAQIEMLDAILLDIMMPTIDGFEILRSLQSHPKTQDIPVIILTAKVNTLAQLNRMSLTVSGLILKPFNPPKLPAKIAELLDWSF